MIFFATEEEALEDKAAHEAASIDANGRCVLRKEHIQKLIRAAALDSGLSPAAIAALSNRKSRRAAQVPL